MTVYTPPPASPQSIAMSALMKMEFVDFGDIPFNLFVREEGQLTAGTSISSVNPLTVKRALQTLV